MAAVAQMRARGVHAVRTASTSSDATSGCGRAVDDARRVAGGVNVVDAARRSGSATAPVRRSSHRHRRTRERSLASASSVVPGRGCSSWSSTTLPSGPVTGTMPAREAAFRRSRPLPAAGSRPRTRRRRRGEAFDGRDEVRRDALRHCRVALAKRGIAAVDRHRSGREAPARHRLDAARDDEILLSAADAHGREGDRLLGGAAEAVERHARHGFRPSRQERRESTDGVVVTGEDAVAGDDVVDVDRLEADSRGERLEALREQRLRVHTVERAVGAALAARCADNVDEPCVRHAGSSLAPCRNSHQRIGGFRRGARGRDREGAAVPSPWLRRRDRVRRAGDRASR